MTLHEAFSLALRERGIYKKLNIDRSTVSGYRSRRCSDDLKREVLQKLGWNFSENWQKHG